MLTVHMSGLMYFDGCHSEKKLALVPNGRRPDVAAGVPGYIPPHHASIWVERGEIRAHHWPPNEIFEYELEILLPNGELGRAPVTEFRIPEPAIVTFPDTQDYPAVFGDFENTLPRLQQIDNAFEVDFDGPDIIAQVPIRGGSLDTFDFKQIASVKWTIAHATDPITICANEYFITLTPENAEVVFSNNSDLIRPEPKGCCDRNHFFLYAKIEKRRDGRRLEKPPYSSGLDPLQFTHTYLKFLSRKPLDDSGCTGTCCR